MLSFAHLSFTQSFRNFAKNTTVSQPCSVQNFKTIGQLQNKVWANEAGPVYTAAGD